MTSRRVLADTRWLPGVAGPDRGRPSRWGGGAAWSPVPPLGNCRPGAGHLAGSGQMRVVMQQVMQSRATGAKGMPMRSAISTIWRGGVTASPTSATRGRKRGRAAFSRGPRWTQRPASSSRSGRPNSVQKRRPVVVAGQADEDLVAVGGFKRLIDRPGAFAGGHGRDFPAR